MTIKIMDVWAQYGGAKIELVTSKGNRFLALITLEGISFYSDESSSGTLLGKPIKRSADEILDWIGSEGANKPFAERKQVRARLLIA